MNMKHPILLCLLAAAVCAATFSCAASRRSVDGSAAGSGGDTVAAAAIAQGSLRIRVDMAKTMRGSVIPVGPEFFIELRGDTVCSYLPYFGRAYAASIGDRGALDFEARPTAFSSDGTPGGGRRIEFKVRTVEDLFRFSIEIDADGRVSISVQPQRRDRISFSGDVVER